MTPRRIDKIDSALVLIFLYLLIIFHPANYKLVLIIRPVDVVMVLFIGWSIFKFSLFDLNKNNYQAALLNKTALLVWSYFLIFIVSTIFGLIKIGIVTPTNIAFFYKYFAFFLFFLASKTALLKATTLQIKNLTIFLLIVFCLMVLNIILNVYHPNKTLHPGYFLLKHTIAMSSQSFRLRPSFPFSAGFFSDAHIYASYLSNGFVSILGFLVFKNIRFGFLLALTIALLSIPPMMLTGARGGVAIHILCISLVFMVGVYTNRNNIKKINLWGVFLFAALTPVLFLIIAFSVKSGVLEVREEVHYIVSRLTLLNVEMFSPRLTKIVESIGLVVKEGPILIGIGMLSTGQVFLDNAIAAILLSSGVIGCILFGFIVANFLKRSFKTARQNNRMSEFLILIFVVANYILNNIVVSEFFLVTRSMVPFVLLCCLIRAVINKPEIGHSNPLSF